MGARSRIASVLPLLVLAAAAPRAAAHQEATVALGVTFGGDATYRLDLVLDAEHLPPLPPVAPAEACGKRDEAERRERERRPPFSRSTPASKAASSR